MDSFLEGGSCDPYSKRKTFFAENLRKSLARSSDANESHGKVKPKPEETPQSRIIILVDETGSMDACKDATIASYRHRLNHLRKIKRIDIVQYRRLTPK